MGDVEGAEGDNGDDDVETFEGNGWIGIGRANRMEGGVDDWMDTRGASWMDVGDDS